MPVVVMQDLFALDIVFDFDRTELDVLICKDVKMDNVSMAECEKEDRGAMGM